MISNEQERRGQYPFDIRHRHVLSYEPDSPQDFERLQTELVSRLKALIGPERTNASDGGHGIVRAHC
jgi:hypothetical protein